MTGRSSAGIDLPNSRLRIWADSQDPHRLDPHRFLAAFKSSIGPQRVGCPRKSLTSLVGPGRIRPHLEEEKSWRSSGKKTDPRIWQNRGFQIGNFPQIPERR
jgi:hypothetical protein